MDQNDREQSLDGNKPPEDSGDNFPLGYGSTNNDSPEESLNDDDALGVYWEGLVEKGIYQNLPNKRTDANILLEALSESKQIAIFPPDLHHHMRAMGHDIDRNSLYQALADLEDFCFVFLPDRYSHADHNVVVKNVDMVESYLEGRLTPSPNAAPQGRPKFMAIYVGECIWKNIDFNPWEAWAYSMVRQCFETQNPVIELNKLGKLAPSETGDSDDPSWLEDFTYQEKYKQVQNFSNKFEQYVISLNISNINHSPYEREVFEERIVDQLTMLQSKILECDISNTDELEQELRVINNSPEKHLFEQDFFDIDFRWSEESVAIASYHVIRGEKI
jgi:hypothetical protein